MPRPTPLERLNNPIRQLRGLLVSPGRSALNQKKLSEIVDCPLDTVRGIEAGRAPLSKLVQNRILCETGAAWNQQDELWRFWKVSGPVYAREHYLQFRESIERQQEWDINLDVFLAQERIRLLLEKLPAKARFKFYFRLNTFLEESRKEFCPEAFTELFRDMSSFIEVRPELDRDRPLAVRRGYPPEILSRITWDRSGVTIDPKKLSQPDRLTLDDLNQLEREVRPIRFDLKGYQEGLKRRKEPLSGRGAVESQGAPAKRQGGGMVKRQGAVKRRGRKQPLPVSP